MYAPELITREGFGVHLDRGGLLTFWRKLSTNRVRLASSRAKIGLINVTVPMPQNDAETAYVAFAIVDELVDLLVTKKLIHDTEVKLVFERAASRRDHNKRGP
jgi:hypothetical protein